MKSTILGIQVKYILRIISIEFDGKYSAFLPHLLDKGGLFRNRRYSTRDKFTAPEVAEWMKTSLAVRNSVNKAIGNLKTQEWNVKIVAHNQEDLQLLKVRTVF